MGLGVSKKIQGVPATVSSYYDCRRWILNTEWSPSRCIQSLKFKTNSSKLTSVFRGGMSLVWVGWLSFDLRAHIAWSDTPLFSIYYIVILWCQRYYPRLTGFDNEVHFHWIYGTGKWTDRLKTWQCVFDPTVRYRRSSSNWNWIWASLKYRLKFAFLFQQQMLYQVLFTLTCRRWAELSAFGPRSQRAHWSTHFLVFRTPNRPSVPWGSNLRSISTRCPKGRRR